MRRIAISVAAAVLAATPALAADPIGRFQIVVAPGAPAHTMLIDSATGQTWLLVSDKEGTTAWEAIHFWPGSAPGASLSAMPPPPLPSGAAPKK